MMLYLNDFSKNLPKSHGQSISFLLQQIPASLSSFQSSFHNGLSPDATHSNT